MNTILPKIRDPDLTGNRVKSARMLAGYTRTAFSKRVGISISTLRSWEEPQAGRKGITEKGAEILTNYLQKCGIYCTVQWILRGEGRSPILMDGKKENLLKGFEEITWGEEEAIFKDIQSFKTNNPNAVVEIITDNSMLPFYAFGDYVGGIKRSNEELQQLVGSNCIVGVYDTILVRRISLHNGKNRFTLTVLSADPTTTQPVIPNVEIEFAAKIIWHRSKEKLLYTIS